MRNQPGDKKQSVALTIAFIFSAFVFLAWATSFFGDINKGQLAGTAETIKQNNPFETLKDDFQTLLQK